MLDYYAQRAELVRVDGSRSPDEVTKELITELEKVQRSLTL
jgi:adenylate kinase family enzyme